MERTAFTISSKENKGLPSKKSSGRLDKLFWLTHQSPSPNSGQVCTDCGMVVSQKGTKAQIVVWHTHVSIIALRRDYASNR